MQSAASGGNQAEAENQASLEQLGYKQELKRSLSISDLIIYGLIFMVPIAPFGIYGIVADGSKGMVALAYVIGMIGMIFTAFSYARMSNAFPIAGSVYSYASRGINEVAGFFAGWLILLDYVLVPALLYVVSAAALSSIIPDVPLFAWAVLFIAINTVINIRGIEFTASANKIILVFELIVLAIFLVVGVSAIAAGVNGASFTTKPLYDPDNFSLGLVMSAVSIAVLSYLGFDGITTLSEESKGDRKAPGTATVAALLIVGVLFIAQTWVAALIVPDFSSFKNLDVAFYDVAEVAGGLWLKTLCSIATAIAWGIANALAAQAAISRILYSMSRDRYLPASLAKIHPTFKTPYVATIFVAIVSLVVTGIFSSQIGALASLVNFGALTAFLLLHISVVNHFLVRQQSKDYLRYLILPILGFVVIAYVWLNLDAGSKTLGITWLAIGIVYFLVLTYVLKRKPANLGL